MRFVLQLCDLHNGIIRRSGLLVIVFGSGKQPC